MLGDAPGCSEMLRDAPRCSEMLGDARMAAVGGRRRDFRGLSGGTEEVAGLPWNIHVDDRQTRRLPVGIAT